METWIEEMWPDAFETADGAGSIWLDVETKKVPAPVGWPFKNRWSVFMVSVAFQVEQDLHFQVYSGTEAEIISILNRVLETVQPVLRISYHATREFDEMVLCGRFTNARRAHADHPGSWPHLPGGLPWRNLRGNLANVGLEREPDLEGKDVPERWEKNEGTDRALIAWHCYKDVAQLLLGDPEADLTMDVWLNLAEDYQSPTAQRMWLEAAAD